MKALKQSRRGAASVELAVSVIFLVPLIMYMLFLQDMLIMKLNGQEAAVQATWDFTILDYGSAQPADGIANFSRLTYCDHSAAYDSYDNKFECKDARHHKAMTAHECWTGVDHKNYGGQVKCSSSEPLTPNGAATSAVADFGNGGVVNCSSRLGIVNYYLPNSFLNNFRGGKGFTVNVDASGKNKMRMKSRWAVGVAGTPSAQDEVHEVVEGEEDVLKENGDTSLGSNYWRLALTEHSMLVDSWALGPTGGIDPTRPGSGPLYERIEAAYGTASDATEKAEEWNEEIEDAEMLAEESRDDIVGDDVTTAAAAFKPNSAQQPFGGHWAAQWGDSRVQATEGSRRDGYFGLAQ